MSQHDIEEVELNITQAKEFVALGRSLERLMSNRDFKKIFREEYFEKEAVRLVHLKGDHNMQTPESQSSIEKQMDAISSVTMFLNKVQHQAYLAEKAIEDGEDALESLRNEETE